MSHWPWYAWCLLAIIVFLALRFARSLVFVREVVEDVGFPDLTMRYLLKILGIVSEMCWLKGSYLFNSRAELFQAKMPGPNLLITYRPAKRAGGVEFFALQRGGYRGTIVLGVKAGKVRKFWQNCERRSVPDLSQPDQALLLRTFEQVRQAYAAKCSGDN